MFTPADFGCPYASEAAGVRLAPDGLGCGVCGAPAAAVLFPCGHMGCCPDCEEKAPGCPVCGVLLVTGGVIK